MQEKNLNRVIIAHININSLVNKFDKLKLLIQNNIDILIVGETRVDDTFSNNQFNIDSFSKPYRMDRNRFGGEVMIFIREDILNKVVFKHTFPDDIESMLIEINLKNSKFLLLGGYRPPRQSDIYIFLKQLIEPWTCMGTRLRNYYPLVILLPMQLSFVLRRFWMQMTLKILSKIILVSKTLLIPAALTFS